MSADIIARAIAVQTRRRLARAQQPLDNWARTFRRAGDPYPAMAVPPAITLSPNTSTLIASTNFAVIPVDPSDPRLTYAGSGSEPSGSYRVGTGTTSVDGTRSGQLRVRFMTDAPAFEVVTVGGANQRFNMIVDGQYMTRSNNGTPQMPNSGQPVYLKYDFGSAGEERPFSYSQVSRIANGSGYAVNDIVTVDGGTFTRPARLRVVQLAGGGVATFSVEDGGAYSVLPTGSAVTTTAVTGSGSGATFGAPVISQTRSVRRMRRIELVMDAGVRFRGLTLLPQDTLLAWPTARGAPKVMVVGDSQNAGTYLGFPGGNMAYNWTQRLGLFDNMVLSANGGTGWIVANGIASAWSHPNRVADVIAQAPDLLVYDGSQNDGTSNLAGVTAAVTATLNAVLAALPAVRVILAGPVIGGTVAYMDALRAAVAQLADPARVRIIDNVAEGWIGTTAGASVTNQTGASNRDFYMASDTVHLTQFGTEYRAAILAERVANRIADMV